jgi:ATP-dependent helicase/nuclease subunit A
MSDARLRDAGLAADSAARARALDVSRSFLVQAPAGSGKTELLIQRYLALLACVDRPERIVALTFTRKAAGEMRERIVDALRRAAPERPPPAEAHERLTWTLAKAALEQNARHDWQIAEHPARLAVQTLDSFCTGLAQQAPLVTRLGAAPRFVDLARPLYEAAVRDALATAAPDDPAWRGLLAHLDNNAASAVSLLADLLARRDRVLDALQPRTSGDLRGELERALRAEVEAELARVRGEFPSRFAAPLARLLRYALENAEGAARLAPLRERLAAFATDGDLPPAQVGHAEAWGSLARWLLTSGDEPQFRRKVDRNDGFPPKGSGAGAAERGARNEEMRALLAELAGERGLAAALDTARRLPPRAYTEDAWAVVSSLAELAPRLAAHLKLAFHDAGALDFTEGANAAMQALGDEDAPTDLLLKLDARIHHLLVDEFQDTSYAQVDLLARLTAGWQEGDGRTLFAVGDPMQSIYRFRGAEVGIFVGAQEEGRIARIEVEGLRLERNFRSQKCLVDWVNRVFREVLPAHNDRSRGAVQFVPAASVKDGTAHGVEVRVFPDLDAEAAHVVRRVVEARERGDTVAVLARARAHLGPILRTLREANVAYAAVDLDALGERPAILDLASLAHAIAQPADRLAWLAVLRAPWCGLALPDLFAVSTAAQAHADGFIAGLVLDGRPVDAMSADGRVRLEAAARVLRAAIAARGRASLTARVRGAWLALGGPATLEERLDLDAAERFFDVLAEHEAGADVPDWSAFCGALAELRAAPAAGADDRVQVMTLHKAKGLEFDTVILPGLARGTRNFDPEILRFRRRPHGLLLAPRKAVGGGDDSLYAYLGTLDADEGRAELGRLLYVGATRAKARLHLTGVLGTDESEDGVLRWVDPRKGSALAQLWDAVGSEVDLPAAAGKGAGDDEAPPAQRFLFRNPPGWAVPAAVPGVPVVPRIEAKEERVPFDWARETAKHVGVVAHRLLAQIAREGLDRWDELRVAAALPRIRAELEEEGIDGRELDRAASEVAAVATGALADPRGRWLLDPARDEATSEWALAGVDDGEIAHVVLDRSFVADGMRWIVDFKTGQHEGADVDAFLDREVQRYSSQLERYARLVRGLDARPIRLALYYPLLRGFRHWDYGG